MNYKEIYENESQLLEDFHNERKSRLQKIENNILHGSLTEQISYEHLIKSWFAFIEGSGGAAVANIDSTHREERAMYHIEQAIKEIKINPNIYSTPHGK